MSDLITFLVSALICIVILAFPARRSRWWRIAAVPVWMFTLGMALRICGRSYPGIHYPNSEFLNHLLNGSGLFTTYGYNLVFALGVADAAFAYLTRFRRAEAPPALGRRLTAVRIGLLALILLIVGYGFFYAIVLERIPGFEVY